LHEFNDLKATSGGSLIRPPYPPDPPHNEIMGRLRWIRLQKKGYQPFLPFPSAAALLSLAGCLGLPVAVSLSQVRPHV